MRQIKKIELIILLFVPINLCFCNLALSIDTKEEITQYIAKLNPILINVQIATRNTNQQMMGLGGSVTNMDEAIDSLSHLNPPPAFARQHKMILLSFKKLRLGFYLMSHMQITEQNRDVFLRVVRGGRDLLRLAVRDIVEFSKKEGIIKQKEDAK